MIPFRSFMILIIITLCVLFGLYKLKEGLNFNNIPQNYLQLSGTIYLAPPYVGNMTSSGFTMSGVKQGSLNY
jgi:hypothetical protein